jgi:hypothetical protein
MGTVAGATIAGFPGLIASIIGTTATLSIFDFQSVYNKIFRPRHFVSILDLSKYLSEHPFIACT